jgi:signal transduction histidine kinase
MLSHKNRERHRCDGVPATCNAEVQRLLGLCAVGMAHDLRNVLNAIFLHVQVLERADLQDRATVTASVAQLRKSVVIGAELLDRIRDFARGSDRGGAWVDLNEVLAASCELVKLRVPVEGVERSTISREPGAVCPVIGKRGEIVSAVMNLLLNALDAKPHGGHIKVRTGSTSREAWIEVVDDGPGIPAAVRGRMFEPFFTTKGTAGTGLGLASVADCARHHRGTVRVHTAPGRGTSIAIRFPAARSEVEHAKGRDHGPV